MAGWHKSEAERSWLCQVAQDDKSDEVGRSWLRHVAKDTKSSDKGRGRGNRTDTLVNEA